MAVTDREKFTLISSTSWASFIKLLAVSVTMDKFYDFAAAGMGRIYSERDHHVLTLDVT